MSSHEIFGQKLYDGKTKTIYSMIDQPGLVCIQRKDSYHYSLPSTTVSENTVMRSRASSIININSIMMKNIRKQSAIKAYYDIHGKGALTTSITICVFEILRDAVIPTYYVAPHPQSDIFIARKCTMIPILWIIRRLANETYIKRYPGIQKGHRFIPPLVEIYYKRHPVVYKKPILVDLETDTDSTESIIDDEDDEEDESCVIIWSYEQLLNAKFDIENMKITQTEVECMHETVCAVFDILEHVWLINTNCQLIDLKLEFGITTTKEIVVANVIDIETWHLVRNDLILNQQLPSSNTFSTKQNCIHGDSDEDEIKNIKENIIWINDCLRDILDMNKQQSNRGKRKSIVQQQTVNETDETQIQMPEATFSQHEQTYLNKESTLTTTTKLFQSSGRCIIVCSTSKDIEHGNRMKLILNESGIQCDLRLCSTYKSTQAILKLLAHYTFEHHRPTIFITIGNISNGLAMVLSANSQYPIIHCSVINDTATTNHFLDINSFIMENISYSLVFSIQSAIQTVMQILAMQDWRLWCKQRGKRLRSYIDLLIGDQHLTLASNKNS
ncbi:unnamed protein product [Didymodactylos carnosus]|uniref:Phosphoribosylaminoimidazole carboxylase n=1 Tax=Didymodactylos carnosus TaxID=1234261 RepID=A0A814Q600_9BILA|nr:unnamed protein product [Didymodactylos carnosus]CAF1115318.1 unnamed protein product [Didymodactylos carnosus]CAF3712037.1 unnamed protein product [Didymodactylos carnosus]CAF3879211.1 unnamed protein product [Didymodactylos carnosus]